MAEAFEQGGDAGQAGVDGVYAGEDGVEFVGDAFLLGERR